MPHTLPGSASPFRETTDSEGEAHQRHAPRPRGHERDPGEEPVVVPEQLGGPHDGRLREGLLHGQLPRELRQVFIHGQKHARSKEQGGQGEIPRHSISEAGKKSKRGSFARGRAWRGCMPASIELLRNGRQRRTRERSPSSSGRKGVRSRAKKKKNMVTQLQRRS